MEEHSLKELDQPLSRTNNPIENPSPSSLEPSRKVAQGQENVEESQQVETHSASSLNRSKDHVPTDLVSEILLRLPVKLILRFQAVSKDWRTLIKGPKFSRSHLKFPPTEGQYSNHHLLFTNSVIKYCPLLSVLREPSTTQLYNLDCPFLQPDESVSVVGSVNGLVCLIKKIELFLWNPVLGESKQLPSSNISEEDSEDVHYGFGYDEVNGDYKVVSLFDKRDFIGGPAYKTEVKVYSLRTNSWRRIDDFIGNIPVMDNGKYASGKIHWTSTDIHWTSTGPLDSRWDYKIVSLDMKDEIYGELEPPHFDYELEDSDWELGVVGGKLLVICQKKEERIADLWVMKEYGVKESWTKVISVPFSSRLPKILHFINDNEIVLASEKLLQDYKSENDKLTNLLPLTYGFSTPDRIFDVNVYVESLVSPAAYDVANAQHL